VSVAEAGPGFQKPRGAPGMARWQRLYHERVAPVFRTRLYLRRLADAGI